VCTHAASVSRRRPSFMAQFALATFTFFCALGYTHADRYTAKWTANKITLDDTGVNFSSLPHIAIKSRPTDEKYANSMHPVPRAFVARRIRTWGFGGACAVVVWRGPPPHIPPSSQQLSSRLFTRLSRTQPAEHGPSAGIGCTHSLSVHCRFVLSTRGGNRVRPRSAAPKCRARPLARPSSRLNNSKARSGHAHVCVR
jgi:hypothetical protein